MDLYTICILVFSSVALMIVGIDIVRNSDERLIVTRMKRFAGEERAEKSKKAMPAKKEMFRRMLARAGDFSITKKLGKKIDKKLEEADILLRGSEFVAMVMAISVGATLVSFALTVKLFLSIIAGIIASIIPFVIVNSTRQKRLANFHSQIGDALTIMSNSLRSGFSFIQSMDMVSKELADPIKKEFNRTIVEINMGASTETALLNLAKRVNSDDLDLIITAVLIQRQVGGNLAEVLDNIAAAVRERIRIKGEIKTLTAQGRISGLIIGLLPFLLLAFMLVANPQYIMELFTTKIGLIMLTFAVLGQIIGLMIIRRIVDIRF